ncbi:MAG: nucleoside-diphosphate kinase [Spirochaetaceae bacterium]|jgi:nucleoside diphosphate kinase|nr:nucleoside-diphosphate kinase [Spirochaetaceae bacterium]
MNSISYVLITPYTIAKSRTGGLLARLMTRSDLELVGAQMIAPDKPFVDAYAESLRRQAAPNPSFLADYVEQSLAPSGGRRRRSLFLLFSGEDTHRKLAEICGHLYPEHRPISSIPGETIRDTYGDLIVSEDDPEKFTFFEPAVLTPRSKEEADANLKLFVNLLKKSDNIIENIEYPDPSKIERTLVIIKPDNWAFASARPGTILDMFSQTGLRIIGIKIHHMCQDEALDFYGPVEDALKDKLSPIFGKKAREILEQHFAVQLDETVEKSLSDSFGAAYARDQFYQIVEFMSGHRPDKTETHAAKCMIVVYEGENAVKKIRDVLGPTDPLKAPAGTIRREFGSNVMVNAAHASDSSESFMREQKIVRIHENETARLIDAYLSSYA